MTIEQRARVSAANTGRLRTAESRAKVVGPRNPNWKGDAVGYDGVHIWLRQNKTRTGVCELCGARPNPSRRRTTGTEFANISGDYLRVISDYLELCRSCHYHFDRGRG